MRLEEIARMKGRQERMGKREGQCKKKKKKGREIAGRKYREEVGEASGREDEVKERMKQ